MLTKSRVILEHDSLILLFGGSGGINYEATLENAIEKYNVGKDKIIDAIEFYYDILIDHPFIDGNKRTATHFLEHLLEINGYKFIASNKELVALALDFARKNEKVQKEMGKQIEKSEVSKILMKYIKRG